MATSALGPPSTGSQKRARPAPKGMRRNRRRRWALGAAAALLVAALVSGGVAIVRGRDASVLAERHVIEAVTTRSLQLTRTDRAVAALMAVAAWQRWPDDVRTRSALLGTMTAAAGYVGTTYLPDASQPTAAAPIPGTRSVALVRDSDTLEVRDVDTGALLRTVTADLDLATSGTSPWVRVSADGGTVLVMQHVDEAPVSAAADPDPRADRDEVLAFVELATGDRIGRPVHVAERADSVDLSPDGRYATWASTGATVIVDRERATVTRVDATAPASGGGADSSLAASAFRPDGRIVATDVDDRFFVIDPATGVVESTGTVPDGSGGAQLAVAVDGTVVTSGGTAIAALAANGAPRWRVVPTDGDECGRIAVSAVQRVLVCGSRAASGRITMRSLDTGALVPGSFDSQPSAAGEPVLAPDESEVWVMSASSPRIGRMRIDGGGPAATTVGGPDGYALGGTDPSGRFLVTGSRAARDAGPGDERPLTVWDTRSGTVVADLTTFTDPDPARTQAYAVAAQWIGAGRLFLVFYDPQVAGQHYVLYDAVHQIATKAVFEDPITWFFPARAGRLYALVPVDPGADRFRLVRYDQVTLRPVGDAFDVDVAPETVSVTADGSLIVVTGWSAARHLWLTRVYSPDGTVVAQRAGDITRTTVAGDRVLASGVAGLQALTLDLEPVESLASPVARPVDLSTDDDGRTLLATTGGSNGLRIVDLSSGRVLGRPIDVYGRSEPAVIDADGSGFVASGARGAQNWTLDPDAHAAAACRIAGRELTPEEWKTFLADLGPWHPLCTDVLATSDGASTG